MARTRHGHHIPGSVKDDDLPKSVARCGGPTFCSRCKQDADLFAIRKVADGLEPKGQSDER